MSYLHIAADAKTGVSPSAGRMPQLPRQEFLHQHPIALMQLPLDAYATPNRENLALAIHMMATHSQDKLATFIRPTHGPCEIESSD